MRTAALVLAAVFAVSPVVEPETPSPTREQALEWIGSGNVDARRQAAAALGDLGTMADAPVLLRALRDQDEAVRQLAERSLWQVWSRSGDPEIDALFQLGLEQMRRGDLPAAIETFTTIIRRKPDFAEGWNKRATLYYLAGEYDKSLRDCDEVMKLNPFHWGALAGYGQVYLALGKPELALEYFERALRINPNLERVEAAVKDLKRLLIERRKGTI